MQANSFQIFFLLLLELYLSSEVAICVFFFIVLCSMIFFSSLCSLWSSLIYSVWFRRYVWRIHRNTCLCDIESFMYGVRHHSLVCKLFMLLMVIFLENRRTLVITGNVQNPFVWLPPYWYREVGSDVRDCAYYVVYKAFHHAWTKTPPGIGSPVWYLTVSEMFCEVSIYPCIIKSNCAGCLEIRTNNSWYLVYTYNICLNKGLQIPM